MLAWMGQRLGRLADWITEFVPDDLFDVDLGDD